MKKIILKVIVFFLILLGLLMYLSFVFTPKDNNTKTGKKNDGFDNVMGEKENSVDVIIMGNSESSTSVIPMKIWEDCGYTSYICGYPGATLPDAIKDLYYVTQKQKPKILVLEANMFYDDVSIIVPFSRVIQTLLPITEYHDRWKEIQITDFYKSPEYTHTDYLKGFRYKTNIQPADSSNYMIPSDDIEEISFKSKLYLQIIKSYCDKIGTKLVIISVPTTKYWSCAKHNGIQALADKENINFLDFNLLINDLNIDWNTDTLDGGDHLNYTGSIKITEYFEKYLTDMNILENHKNDGNYSSWNEDLIKFKEKISKGNTDNNEDLGD